MLDISKSIDACAAHYGDEADAMRAYLLQGQEKALALPNRGPIKFDTDGKLDPTIRAAYAEYGFYIFTGLIKEQELADIQTDMDALRSTFPTTSGAELDSNGNTALGVGHQAPSLLWSKPLSDPFGGTPVANGRHQVKYFEPKAAENAPEFSPYILLGHLQFSEACLRLYGHPDLLRVSENIHGEDFTPFNESMFIKDPGLGAAVSWHQDGDTHWDSPDFNEDIHGYNFMVQVYGSTAVNGVWVVPGSHKVGRIDIKEKVATAGTERLPDAVPIICDAGDVVICNRQALHGSFANTGFEKRLSINFGFHRKSSVLNVQGAGIHALSVEYDEARIKERSKAIALAIDARAQKYTDETPYNYAPLAAENIKFSPAPFNGLKDYNLLDLSI